MPSCALRYCKNTTRNTNKNKGVTFHLFPRQGQEIRERWIQFVQTDRSEFMWLPTEHSTICSAHFKQIDKHTTKAGRVFLKKSAVPCANPTKYCDEEESKSDIYDSPRKNALKYKLQKEIVAKKKLAQKFKIRQQNHHLKLRTSYKTIVRNLIDIFGLNSNAEVDLMAKADILELNRSLIRKRKRSKHSLLVPLRKFALTLHYYSPAAYKYVREYYNKALPHPRTICRWYSSINAEPGFTKEAFTALKNKSQSNANCNKPVPCSLVFDELAIRRQNLFRNQKLGAVNFGAGPMQGEEDETVATQALVFMVVSFNENWKLPVGYFLTAEINGDNKANLIKICLQKCHEVGVNILSLTFKGCAANFDAVEILGCKLSDVNNMKTHFPHPCTGHKVCIFIDPCHVIKLIRNTFEKKRLLFDNNGQQIKWQLIFNLNKLQQNERIRFANKLTTRHINFREQIMKVKLATQLMSMSVTKTLLLCEKVLNSSKFQNSPGTVNFIILMNMFFDIINSRNCPVDITTKNELFSYLEKVKSYIIQLKFRIQFKKIIKPRNQISKIVIVQTKKNLVSSANKTGFIGAIICIESLKTLYNDIVEEKQMLKCISPYRLSLDHLELYFGLIRKYGGYNNNPDIIQFRAAYKKSLNHLELRSSLRSNCIPLDNFTILNHIASENIINSTACPYKHEEPYEILKSTRQLKSTLEAEEICEILATMLDHEGTCDSKLIVGYMSGYVSRELIKKLKCETCIDSLTTSTRLPHHALITIEDMGGLCYSAEDVHKICLATEKNIRNFIRQGSGSLSSKRDFNYITVNTLKIFIEKEVFTNLVQHSLNQPATLNHRIHLIRAIIHQYTKMRLHYEAKTDPRPVKPQKLILF